MRHPAYARIMRIHYSLNYLQHLTTLFCTAGFTTDGEFNSLRTNGKNRPVSVIQIIKDAKNKAKSITVNTITKFFTLDANGT